MNGLRRPWWKRKRWIVMAIAWFAAAYLLGAGPVLYAGARGWLSMAIVDAYMQPIECAFDGIEDTYEGYLFWWEEIGEEAAGR